MNTAWAIIINFVLYMSVVTSWFLDKRFYKCRMGNN